MDVGLAQAAIGAVVVILAFAGVAYLRWSNAYVGLPEAQKRRKAELRGQIESRAPATVRIPKGDDLDAHRETIRVLFDGRDAEPERETIRSALGTVYATLMGAVRGRTSSLPRTAIVLTEEALLVLLLGAIVFVPSSALVGAFETDGFSLQAFLNGSIDALQQVADASLAAAGAFPLAETVWALLLTGTITGGRLLYEHWYVTAALLLVTAVALVVAARRAPDDAEAHVFGTVTGPAITVVAALATVYILGVVPVVLFGAAGYGEVGTLVGVVLSLAGVVIWACIAGKWFVFRLTELGRGDGVDYQTAAYVLIDRGGVVVGALVAPLVLLYAAQAVVEGHLVATAQAIVTGPPALQALLVGVLAVGVVTIARGAQGAWGDLQAGLAETLSRQAVRSALLGRGLPVSILVFATVVGRGLGAPTAAAVIVAVGLAGLARGGYILAHRARRRARAFDPNPTTASRLVVAAYTLDTGEGEVYFARVNTIAVARTDRDAVVDAILEVGEQLFEEGEADPSLAQAFADDLLQLGFADESDTRNRLRTEVKEELHHRFERKDGVVQEPEFREDVVGRIPESVVNDRLREWCGNGRILKRGEYLHRV